MKETERLWLRSLPLVDRVILKAESLIEVGIKFWAKLCRKKTYSSLGLTLPRKWREGR